MDIRIAVPQRPGPRGPRAGSRVVLVSLALLAAPIPSMGQASATDASSAPDPWGPFRLLIGTWEAGIDGALGQGEGRRTYEFYIDDLYLVHRHASVRPPQPASPNGDHHRELAVYSYDRERRVIVLREFMEEGYVLRSTCETEAKRFVCVSEDIESGSGMRSRLTIDIESAYRFTETFELAGPGEELTDLFQNTWRRVPEV